MAASSSPCDSISPQRHRRVRRPHHSKHSHRDNSRLDRKLHEELSSSSSSSSESHSSSSSSDSESNSGAIVNTLTLKRDKNDEGFKFRKRKHRDGSLSSTSDSVSEGSERRHKIRKEKYNKKVYRIRKNTKRGRVNTSTSVTGVKR
ncbi:hypothetical protein O6H91_08G060200 [Diphasiastrum complanatum]|uniref:Uncharacterized protein n=1 Tax=Diphasiastrum complanatum TaxID=34168 RepID=A0ACC2CYA8_DIPCM|nr:hypothetical protein O6H91_08G060200 [Diphasiastrum complanatum]